MGRGGGKWRGVARVNEFLLLRIHILKKKKKLFFFFWGGGGGGGVKGRVCGGGG